MRKRLQASYLSNDRQDDSVSSFQCQRAGQKHQNFAFANHSLSLLTVPVILLAGPITTFSHSQTFPCQKTVSVAASVSVLCMVFADLCTSHLN